MTAAQYERMTTEELLDQFAELARRAGSVLGSRRLGREKRGPLPKDLVDQLHAITRELETRGPTTKVRELLQDPDPDVRGWAAGQFTMIDPEWANASFHGLLHKLTTKEVLALRERILKGPPKRPKVREMTVEQLVARFEDACERLSIIH